MNEDMDRFDDMLRDLLQEAGPERAPSNFTQNVMAQVVTEAARPKRQWKPIITGWGWAGIAATIAAIVAVGFLVGDDAGTSTSNPLATQTMERVSDLASAFQLPSILPMSMAAMLLLFGLDRYLHKRRSA